MKPATLYPRPMVTVDVVVFSIQDGALNVLLIKRKLAPFVGQWALPGGFVRMDESLDHAALRELQEETGVKGIYLEQLYTFGEVKRDPRGRVITVAYYALTSSAGINLRARTDAVEVKWEDVSKAKNLAFDHQKIFDYALQRLRWKFEYTTAGFALLPKVFTLNDVQKMYEIVFSKPFDKGNFRKKLLSLEILEEIDIQTNVSHRPPKTYRLKSRLGEIVEII